MDDLEWGSGKMGVHNVFGYFQTMEQAQKAAAELKKQGFKTDINRFGPLLGGHPFDGDPEIHSIFTHQTNSLTTTTLGSPDDIAHDDDRRILAAAHIDASGFAGSTGFDHSEDVCVIVFAEEDTYDQAEKILQSFGAKE